MLAADALMLPLGSYKPDFSAHIGSDAVRIARISKVCTLVLLMDNLLAVCAQRRIITLDVVLSH